ncbi:MAG: adenylate/guanylate cyclase domain-containing protein, partial [Pseudomonadota bacterium]
MPRRLKNLLHIRPLTITALVVLVVSLAYVAGVPFLDLMEYRTVDLRFRFRGPVPPGPEVVLAVIDEKSIAAEGKWIWPRSRIAALINALSDAGAAVVGLDVGFLEEDANSTRSTVARVRQILEEKGLAGQEVEAELLRLEEEGDNDRILAEAIRDSSAPVVLGYFFQMNREGLGAITEEQEEEAQDNSRGSLFNVTTRAPGEYILQIPEAEIPEANITVLSRATDWSGYFNMLPDEDGTVRRLPMVIECGGSMYAPLSLKTLQAYRRKQNPEEKANLDLRLSRYGVSELSLGKTRVPVDERGRLLINYRGGTKSFPHISVTDILRDPEKTAGRLKDKIVLVGATAIGIFDLRVAPFSAKDYPGLEIHANVVDNILHENFLVQPNWAQLVDLAAVLVLAGLLGGFLPRMNVSTGAILTLGLFAGYLTLSQLLFTRQGAVLNLVYPSLALLFMYVSTTVYKYVTEEKQKRFLRSAFSTYLAPSVVEQIIKSPEKLALGGEKRLITAFFSDVQGFTSISQKLDPVELVELLNEFLTEMTDIILDNEGTVDKFEGDAIIAFFGAPNDMPDHAARACVACVQMQNKLVALRAKWTAEGKPQLRMRIGM